MSCGLVYGFASLLTHTQAHRDFRAREAKRGGSPVEITSTMTAAASRPRTLLTQVSPSALLGGVDAWRVTDMHNQSAFGFRPTYHNSMARRGGYAAAKPAAPPRGVPR